MRLCYSFNFLYLVIVATFRELVEIVQDQITLENISFNITPLCQFIYLKT